MTIAWNQLKISFLPVVFTQEQSWKYIWPLRDKNAQFIVFVFSVGY